MFASDSRLLLPAGVAVIAFDGAMLGFPLWLSFATGLAVMSVAYAGEVALASRQSSGHPAGGRGEETPGARPSGNRGRFDKSNVPWRKVLGSLAVVVLACFAIEGFLLVDWAAMLSGSSTRVQHEVETGSGAWSIIAPALAYATYRVARWSWR